jgi:iron(III) transport system permease protein
MAKAPSPSLLVRLPESLLVRLPESLTDIPRWLFILAVLLLGYLVIPPVFFIILTSLIAERGPEAGSLTIQHYANILDSLSDFRTLLWNSFVFSTGAASAALLLGTTIAWLVERTNVPFRNLAYIFAFISFGIPGIVNVIGWILLLGPTAGLINVAVRDLTGISPIFDLFSMPGMILVEALVWTPLVFLLMAPPFRSMDPVLEEAAVVAGSSNWQVFKRVTLRLALPSVCAVLMLTSIRAVESFEIPALIGLPAGIEVLTTKIFLEIRGGFLPRYGVASAYSIILIAVVALCLFFFHRLTSQTYSFATITGRGYQPRRIDLGRWRWPAGLLLLSLPFLQVLPIIALIWASLLPYMQPVSEKALALASFKNYWSAFSDGTIILAILNSLTLSMASATATVLLTFIAAWVVVRTNIRRRRVLDQLATIPLVLPGLVMGVAVLQIYLTLPLPVYGTIWIMFFAFVANFLPYGIRFSHAGLLSIHRELEESSAVSGASWLQTALRVLFPVMMPALFAAWIYIFLITIRILSVPLLLYTPGSQVISVTIWELWERGNIGEVAAFSLVITAGTVPLAVFFKRLCHRFAVQV